MAATLAENRYHGIYFGKFNNAWRVEGRLTPLPQGGDLRSHHIEAYRDAILGAIDTELDITLVEP
jgi:hypothetical protein